MDTTHLSCEFSATIRKTNANNIRTQSVDSKPAARLCTLGQSVHCGRFKAFQRGDAGLITATTSDWHATKGKRRRACDEAEGDHCGTNSSAPFPSPFVPGRGSETGGVKLGLHETANAIFTDGERTANVAMRESASRGQPFLP